MIKWIVVLALFLFGAMEITAGEDAYYEQQENSAFMETDEAGLSIINWQYANVHDVFVTSTPNTPSSYTWHEETNLKQGVWVSLISVKNTDIYLQQNNGWMRFNTLRYGLFVRLEAKYDGGSWTTLVNNKTTDASKWIQPPFIGQLGQHTLELRWWDVGNVIHYRSHTVNIVPAAQKLYLDNYGNKLTLWDGGSNGLPILLSEGIDPYNTSGAERLRYVGSDLTSQLLQRGGRIYLLNYRWGGQSLRNNAAVFNSAVQKISVLNSNKKIIASGMSMGGVIARYALAKAEGSTSPLNVLKFVSIDAPQQGANVHASLQRFIKDPPDCGPFESSSKLFGTYGMSCDAAKQLLNYSAFDDGTAHSSFFNELNQLNGDGYPHITKNIAISFSNGYINPNPMGALYMKVRWTGVAGTDICGFEKSFYLESALTVAGSYLPKSITDAPYKQVYWGGITVNRQCDATFIPYTSALDLVNGQSKFNMTMTASVKNYYHDEIPPELVSPIANEILPVQPLTVSIEGPSCLYKYTTGTWYADASGGTGSYTYQWIKDGMQIGTGSSVSTGGIYFTLTVIVTSGSQSTSRSVVVSECTGGGGGCPFLFVKTDDGFTIDNNLLHRSEFAENRGKDITDLYKLNVLPKKENNRYKLAIKELNKDHSYFDQIKLYAVDHPAGTELAVTENNDIVVFDPNTVTSTNDAKIYEQSHTNYLQFSPTRSGISGVKKQSLYLSFPSHINNVQAFTNLKNTLGNSQDKDSTAIIMDPSAVSAQQLPKEIAAVIQYGNSSSNIATIARRESKSVVVVPVDQSLLSEGISMNWNRDFSLGYAGVTKVLYGGYRKQELTLLSANHSATGNVKQSLLIADKKFAELDKLESIDLEFDAGDKIKSGWVRDFVIEVVGRYELQTSNLSKAGVSLKKTESEKATLKVPTYFELGNNYPNPFNPTTTIQYALPRSVRVSLKVYDILGREVADLVNENQPAGTYNVNFDASKFASGVYIYRLEAGEYIGSRRMLLVK
ncbi:T9SS type A sorting domain-containing protein [bacterium]|nr:T9SS type A sorting domain-containing protein [bacterium]